MRNGDITPEEAAELERKGVLKQRDDVKILADRHDREVIFYEDNNLSAFKRNVRRPRFQDMVRDLKAGKLAGMVVYDIDRGFRQPKDLESVIDIYQDFSEKKKVRLIFDTMSGQNFDLSTGDGRFTARLYVNIANKSSEDTSRRIARDNASKARKGVYHGGGPSFGWKEDDRTKLDPKAAGLVRDIVLGHLKGDKIATCMEYLSDKGAVNPTSGKPFTWAGTKTLIFRARNFGIRIYQGEPQLDDEGNYILGDWEPIFTKDDGTPDFDLWERLEALRKGKSPEGSQEKSTVKYLLSRIVRCGRCGYPMVGKTVWVRGTKSQSFAYNCNKSNPDACGKMGVTGPRVDELVKSLVWAQVLRASKNRQVPEPQESWSKEAELKDVEGQIAELKALWEAKEVRAATYVTTLDDLESRRTQLKAERAFHTATPAIRVITPELLKNGWEGLSVERQRIIIRSVLKAVIIHPARDGKKGGPFDPARVEPVFA
ncbi:integrase [Streptomyces phage Ibantik]|uniref:Integrase n=1 Tax=Streptomyces phage Ibantik TaxID=2182397 RepID=A0A2U8UNS3_9CAUD|nr:integrase [Streptomyces phage Ibantik]AWN05230.1 integrase [Streptomyces phage Ibantik]